MSKSVFITFTDARYLLKLLGIWADDWWWLLFICSISAEVNFHLNSVCFLSCFVSRIVFDPSATHSGVMWDILCHHCWGHKANFYYMSTALQMSLPSKQAHCPFQSLPTYEWIRGSKDPEHQILSIQILHSTSSTSLDLLPRVFALLDR